MVRYSLSCARGHGFESWFASAAAFDDLAARGLLACAECGSAEVAKALMAPAVSIREPIVPPRPAAPRAAPTPEALLAALRAHVEANAENVGAAFASEARRIHAGEAPDRAIWGEAAPAEARALLEDGIPVAPLPFVPKRSVN